MIHVSRIGKFISFRFRIFQVKFCISTGKTKFPVLWCWVTREEPLLTRLLRRWEATSCGAALWSSRYIALLTRHSNATRRSTYISSSRDTQQICHIFILYLYYKIWYREKKRKEEGGGGGGRKKSMRIEYVRFPKRFKDLSSYPNGIFQK